MARRPLTEKEEEWKENLRRIWLDKKKELGLTQEKLAEKIGWKTQGAVTSYLNGRLALNTDAKMKFAEALEVTVDQIDPALKPSYTPKTSLEFEEMYGHILDEMSTDQLNRIAGQLEAKIKEKMRRGDL